MTTTLARPTSFPKLAVASGALATTMVGACVPVTGLLIGYPVLSGLAIRYAIGAAVLYVWLRRKGRRLPRPGPRDLLGIAGMIACGMLGFNAAILEAQRYAQPGLIAAMIGGAPLVLALLVPALRGRRPGALALIGAATVTVGVLVLSGGGSWHGPGLALAGLTLIGEVLFTVFGARVAERLGVLETCVLSCALAAIAAAAIGTATTTITATHTTAQATTATSAAAPITIAPASTAPTTTVAGTPAPATTVAATTAPATTPTATTAPATIAPYATAAGPTSPATALNPAQAALAAWPMPSPTQWIALVVLGAVLTAIGFVSWYSSVSALGPDRAAVLIGLIPVSGFAMSIALHAQPITATGIVGTLLVGTGCVVGLRPTATQPGAP